MGFSTSGIDMSVLFVVKEGRGLLFGEVES
jgi:hypothetical protein